MQIRFFLNQNQKKNNEKSPDYWGYIKDEAGEKRQKISAWKKRNDKGEFISVIIDDIVPQESAPAMTINEDDLPF